MTSEQPVARNGWQGINQFVRRVNAIIVLIAQPSLTQFVLRIGLATPFWRSGINKWDRFLQRNDTAVYLFSTECKLHLPGGPYSFPAPEATAFLVGAGEILFPILRVLRLATRLAPCALVAVTLVVELSVRDGWPVHVTWADMALGIMAGGTGRLSLDHWIERRTG